MGYLRDTVENNTVVIGGISYIKVEDVYNLFGKEPVCIPKYLGENPAIGCSIGECQCGNILRSYSRFCDVCGVKQDWDTCLSQSES